MPRQSIQIYGPAEGVGPNTIAEVDEIGEGLVVQEMVHHRVHEGVFFVSGVADEALSNNANLDMLIQAVSGDLHMQFVGSAGADARIGLWEGTTFSDQGTVQPAINRNRNFALTKISDSIISMNPTITDIGTQLFGGLLIGGSGGSATGGTSAAFTEFIFPAGTVHMARLTNIGGQAQLATIEAEFYDTALLD